MSPTDAASDAARRHLHEARGELTAIRGNAALLRRDTGGLAPEERREYAETIEASAVRIDALASAIISALDGASPTPPSPTPDAVTMLLAVMEEDPHVITVVDTELRVVVANAGAREQARHLMRRELTPGISLEDLYAERPEGWLEAREYWTSALAGQERLVTREFPVVGRPGERMGFEIHYRPVHVAGRVVAAVAVARDTTRQLEADRALRAAEREAAEARALAEARTRFVSRMSHELRTPLNAVLGFGQLLVREAEGESRAQAEQVLEAGHRLTRLVDEVLDLARLEAADITVSPETVLLEETVSTVVEELAPALAAQGTTVEVVPHEGPPIAVHADLQRLRQIVRLLLENAGRHGGGRVRLSLQADGLTAGLVVADDGPGIDAAEAETAFEPFGRTASARGDGPGLGLAVARGLARAMAGELELTRTRPEGAAFTLRLPVRWAADSPAAVTDGAEAPTTEGTVLYVEDNPSNTRLMRALLRARPGVVLHVADRGSLGLELAAAHRPDLVLLDVHLPDGSGIDLIAPLRAAAQREDLPVVVLTADASPDTRRRSAAAGATLHLAKPFDVDRLLAIVDQLVGTPR